MNTKLPLLALLLVAACTGPDAESRGLAKGKAEALASCPSLGGGLGFADARTGGPIACTGVEITGADGTRLFLGSTDRNGLVALDPAEGAELTVALDGHKKVTTVPGRPFGDSTPLIELWKDMPSPRLRVLNEDGLALGGAKVTLLRGSEAIFEGQTNPLGALVGVPAELDGLAAKVAGYSEAPVNPAARAVQLALQQPGD